MRGATRLGLVLGNALAFRTMSFILLSMVEGSNESYGFKSVLVDWPGFWGWPSCGVWVFRVSVYRVAFVLSLGLVLWCAVNLAFAGVAANVPMSLPTAKKKVCKIRPGRWAEGELTTHIDTQMTSMPTMLAYRDLVRFIKWLNQLRKIGDFGCVGTEAQGHPFSSQTLSTWRVCNQMQRVLMMLTAAIFCFRISNYPAIRSHL